MLMRAQISKHRSFSERPGAKFRVTCVFLLPAYRALTTYSLFKTSLIKVLHIIAILSLLKLILLHF